MPVDVEQLYQEVLALPPATRADLIDRLLAAETDEADIPPEIEREHLAEVRRRIARVESGEVQLIPGDEALARVRALLSKP